MSAAAPPVVLRRSTRNAAKRESPAVTQAEVAPAPKKKRTAEKKAPPAKKGAVDAVKAAVETAKEAAVATKDAVAEAVAPTKAEAAAAGATTTALKDGDTLPESLPEVQTHAGATTTLAALLKSSEKGIVIFAYPKASTPGCTTQACAFRDSTSIFKDAGYAIYGISGDSPAANEKFKTKQNLADITLLCDPKYELHEKLGIKKGAKGTVRSVIVIKKSADAGAGVIVKKSAASPGQSVDIAKKAIESATAEKET